MRQIPLAIAATALLIGISTASNAACTITGTLIRATMKDDNKKGSHLLYIRDRVTDPFYYKIKTADDELAALASTLAAQQTRVSIKGTARACPKTGNARSMGTVIQIIAVP